MSDRPKNRRALNKLFPYGTSQYDYYPDGPTVPSCVCVCPTCGAKKTHTNSERTHYCEGNNSQTDWKAHPPVRMTWETN